MARKLVVILAFIVAVSAADDGILTALQADGECDAGNDCALNALQIHGEASSKKAKENVTNTDGEQLVASRKQDKTAKIEKDAAKEVSDANSTAHAGKAKAKVNSFVVSNMTEAELEEHGCHRKIPGSSCMVYHCHRSRGPVDCGFMTGYTCRCGPSYCTDGYGCVPAASYFNSYGYR
eukprot:TRINITY_DN2505_c0_g1_i1.p1 TRINITY_DN2505_c0_g1~~TRINITY_DN2505_c0_g1_i1.p1  ORF type:complete len:209 (+),score=33.09 TRINITY_DN2505_c0_g1_i1:96-629(+)